MSPLLRHNENRILAAKPEFLLKYTNSGENLAEKLFGFYRDVIDYKNKYNHYFTDNFIFKTSLFKPFTIIKSSIFNSDPMPEKVVRGNNGWMFLGESHSNVISESKGLTQYNSEELNRLKSNLNNQKKWLDEKGIAYFVAIAPNKHSVYGHYLPIVKSANKSKLQQMKEAAAQINLPLIDLSDYFMDYPNERLFHKTNTHWNDFGAFLGYRKLIHEIQKIYPEIKCMELGDLEKKIEISYQEDLTKMLNIKIKEERILLKKKYEKAAKIPSQLEVPNNFFRLPQDYENRYTSDDNNLKLLMFRDSFSEALIKYMSESFGESIFIWSYRFDKELIEKEKPDIVIMEIVERSSDVFL
ncbi:alginate O-acetyltransferase AlgX-related protein [Xanthovirga aplysinae]|uniref:alginate O-acetyltransferase AlgX-related protein n=1 Tax=Xanthovirga aplysinae TaxID=2529853 RepID=UPI0016570416|nr:hypothetical protein [Xanthovirga aplysinae]